MSSKPTVLVTGSAGHLGKALMLSLPSFGYTPIGIDIKASDTTTLVGSITDRAFIDDVFTSHQIEHVIHAATLHKPHVCSHSKNDFVQTNMAGTLALLERAASPDQPHKPRPRSFVYLSTTSAFGAALSPAPGQPAAWMDESVTPVPKNIYGVSKAAAEDLCRLFHAESGLPIVVLRTSRFFPEEDDDADRRAALPCDENLKVLELAYRRVDIADVVRACVCAVESAASGRVAWGRYIVSAPTPPASSAPPCRAWPSCSPAGDGASCAGSTASTTRRAPCASSAGRPSTRSGGPSRRSPAARSGAARLPSRSASSATTRSRPACIPSGRSRRRVGDDDDDDGLASTVSAYLRSGDINGAVEIRYHSSRAISTLAYLLNGDIDATMSLVGCIFSWLY